MLMSQLQNSLYFIGTYLCPTNSMLQEKTYKVMISEVASSLNINFFSIIFMLKCYRVP